MSVDYPAADSELEILKLSREEAAQQVATEAGEQKSSGGPAAASVSQADVFAARREVLETHLAPKLESYLIELVLASRQTANYGSRLERWIEFGASPRATIGLDRAARACAWLNGRDYVTPEDIHALAPNVLRHRILLSFEAEAEGVTADQVVAELLEQVAVP